MRRAVLLFALLAVPALPSAASAGAQIPPPHCDPAACPNPVEGVQDCASNAITAIRYIVQGTPQPTTCRPLGN